MSSREDDEDHWNKSDIKGFSFNDDEVSSVSSLFEPTRLSGKPRDDGKFDIFFTDIHLVDNKYTSAKKPIEEVICKTSLNKLLDEEECVKKPNYDPNEELKVLKRQQMNQFVPPPASQVIRKIILDQPFSLHLYKSMAEKTKLLDEAVQFGDGNAILSVVLFLRNTLKKKLFNHLLQSKPSIIPIYLNYLTIRFEAREASETLLMLGLIKEASMVDFYFSVLKVRSLDQKLQRVRSLIRDHFSSPDISDKQFILNFCNFLEWQVSVSSSIGGLPESVCGCLNILCSSYWGQPKGQLLSPLTLVGNLNISQRQFHWSALNSRAATENWDDLISLFITKAWISGKKLNSALPAERILKELHKFKAPEVVLNQFIELIDDAERRLEIALKLKWPKAAINAYASLRDRTGLVQYKTSLFPQSEDYLHAESVLRSQVKWKN